MAHQAGQSISKFLAGEQVTILAVFLFCHIITTICEASESISNSNPPDEVLLRDITLPTRLQKRLLRLGMNQINVLSVAREGAQKASINFRVAIKAMSLPNATQ